MSRAQDKKTRKLLKLIQKRGYTVSLGKHYKVHDPATGQLLAVFPHTHGQGRAWSNTLAQLRRAGVLNRGEDPQ